MKCKECGYEISGSICHVCRRAKAWEEKKERNIQSLNFSRRISKNLLKLNIHPKEEDVQTLLNGQGLYLHGKTGSGKTLYASALLLEIDRRSYVYPDISKKESKFIGSLYLLEEIRNSFSAKKEEAEDVRKTTKEILDYYSFVDYLILDDLGSERPTEWALSILQMILNNRYEEILPTIITSNFDLDTLSELLDDRIASRIYEMCRSVSFGEKDYRLGNKY